MPRLMICSRDLHWHWINWTIPCDTMEVSMLRLAWLTTAQHVFQPALAGRLELVSRKIVSCEPRTKAIAVSRFCKKLSPTNWVQGVTAISRNISRSWAPKYGVQHATAIYPIPRYTRPWYIGSTLYVAPARPAGELHLYFERQVQQGGMVSGTKTTKCTGVGTRMEPVDHVRYT